MNIGDDLVGVASFSGGPDAFNRYYRDFCKKSGGSAYHMRRHESACTANPNRQCGMCDGGGYDAADLPVLIALLPNAAAFKGQME